MIRIIQEFASSRRNAYSKCFDLGCQFARHFKKIYTNPNGLEVKHWCKEMQTWYEDVKDIQFKGSHRYISKNNLKNWFFSHGSSFERAFVENPNLYKRFCEEVMNQGSVEGAFKKVGIIK